ncbi:sensory box histidine kinase/response regulator [Candidatus Burkholderia brachyanthoides]|nr:sensory box histidine kinase/response regulator [Candidatus Burkholderia brachyanthoides]
MWEKVVLNLLSNAFKFTFEGAIGRRDRRVALAVDAHGGIEMKVRDTGIGIPDEELARVFERFHRVAGATGRSVEGSGIGLAMVQELVKLHGGAISVGCERTGRVLHRDAARHACGRRTRRARPI